MWCGDVPDLCFRCRSLCDNGGMTPTTALHFKRQRWGCNDATVIWTRQRQSSVQRQQQNKGITRTEYDGNGHCGGKWHANNGPSLQTSSALLHRGSSPPQGAPQNPSEEVPEAHHPYHLWADGREI
eukprot:gene16370-biopygen738